ncbi:MAG: FAD-dependent oxidoreductase [Clostridia bacterium]|nr:FAD-dependent oxidoreductase [Clostridia bacterium]
MRKYNLVVVGGGLSGVAASISAAREGLDVLLIERSGSLGGAISNNLVFPFMKFWEFDKDAKIKRFINTGIFTEIRQTAMEFEDFGDQTGWNLVNFKPEAVKRALDKMVVDANVQVLFHSTVFDASVSDNTIKSVKVLTKSGVIEICADYFVDASGDGDLIALSGCEYQLGREEDGLCQPMTTCFRMSGVDLDLLKKDYPILQEKYKQARANGDIKNPRENILTMTGIGDGILHLNTTRVIKLNPTDAFDLSKAEIIAREQVYEMVKFLKANSCAFNNATVISVADEIGVRESRKLKGLHLLTAKEIISCHKFDDVIAIGNYEIDIHNPSGSGTELHYFKEGENYQIPYRSLLPKEIGNLIVAGRCLSAEHKAHAAVRIMPICACMGQAAGTAVAIAKKDDKKLRDIDVKTLQKRLIENGATLD